jgi:tRNA/rRNA methyltransferase
MSEKIHSNAVLPPPTFQPAVLQRVRVVLTRPSHPGNVGSAARAMKTMGLTQLVLVQPRQLPDAQAEALASGALDVLQSARVVESLAEALTGTIGAVALTARRRELAAEPLWARGAAALAVEELRRDPDQRPWALVFGNETYGLSNEELAQCSHWAMIPANPDYSSLNLAAAVQLLCYELRLAALDPGAPPAVPDAGVAASHDQVEGLLRHVEQAAVDCGFLDPNQPKRLMPRLRRLAGRARLEVEEINILRGLVAALQRSK